MSAEESVALTREDVLDGLFAGHARAAGACLLAIESRTAFLVARSRQAMERFLTEQAAEEREIAFLEALALGRDPPLRPTIQDLERYAAQWAPLVPDNPMVQAAVAHLLGRKYEFSHQAVPATRAALGLDTEAVQQAYRRLYQEPLDSVFTVSISLVHRPRWAWAALGARLESLSPFWTAFSLTLTETVGAGVLALPIALAGVGPVVGVVLLLVLGLVNLLTILALVEALTRNGNVRYGEAYFGRLVADYLGSFGSLILSLSLLVLGLGTLLARYIGLAATLAAATPLPAQVWVGLLFLFGLYLLRRRSLNATVAVALLVGGLNIGVILILSLVTVAQVGLANLGRFSVLPAGPGAFEPSVLGLVFGVTLLAYFGHTSAGNCARVVLRRDPTGRSLVSGNIAALGAAIGLYCVWVLVLDGAIGPAKLAAETGTVLTPLATVVGPVVFLLGSIFVILALGMGSIHDSLGLLNQIREWLPTEGRRVVVLPRRRGRLLLRTASPASRRPEEVVRVGLAYLGFDPGSAGSDPQSHLGLDVEAGGVSNHMEIVVKRNWDVASLLDRLPALRQQGVRLAVTVLEASQEHVRLRIDSPLRMTYEGDWYAPGLTAADLLALDDSELDIVTWMMRLGTSEHEGVSLAEVAEHFGKSEAAVQATLDALIEQGFVQELGVHGETRYRPRLVSRGRRGLPEDIESALAVQEDEALPHGLDRGLRLKTREIALGRNGRFLISVSPVILVFVLAEWLFLSERESFSGPLGFTGTIAATIVSGVFPLLLLVASRRKGDLVPGSVVGFLGHPALVTILYLFFLASLFLHGTIIWQTPLERIAALTVAVLVLGVTASIIRRGSFDSRLVAELREDRSEAARSTFAITVGAHPVLADVELGYPDEVSRLHASSGDISRISALRYASFQLPATDARELEVWAHAITSDGDSEGIPVLLEVEHESGRQEYDLGLSGGQVVLSLEGRPVQLRISLPR